MKNLFPTVFLSILFLLLATSSEATTLPIDSIRTLPTSTPIPTPTPTTTFRRAIITDPTPTPTSSLQRRIQTITVIPTPTPTKTEGNVNVLQPVTGITTGGNSPEIDRSKIGQERWLNPQPEPPIFDSLQVKSTETKSTLTWPNFNTIQTIKSSVVFKPEGAQVVIPQTLNKSQGNVNLLIKPNFKIKENQTILIDNKKEIVLRSLPTAVYQKLNTILSKNNVKLLGDFTLDVQEGKAVYSVNIEEPVKLFGLIPMNMKSKLLVADRDGKAQITGKPWYASVSKEQVDMIGELTKLPNLVVTGIRFEPSQFSEGQENVKVIPIVKNEGLGYAATFPDPISMHGAGVQLDKNNKEYDWYYLMLALAPGETQELYNFTLYKVECGAELTVRAAENDYMDETTKEDNVKSIKLECNK